MGPRREFMPFTKGLSFKGELFWHERFLQCRIFVGGALREAYEHAGNNCLGEVAEIIQSVFGGAVLPSISKKHVTFRIPCQDGFMNESKQIETPFASDAVERIRTKLVDAKNRWLAFPVVTNPMSLQNTLASQMSPSQMSPSQMSLIEAVAHHAEKNGADAALNVVRLLDQWREFPTTN